MISSVLLVCALGALVSSAPAVVYDIEEAETHFEEFIKTFNKSYLSEIEKLKKFEIFKNNLLDINERNNIPGDAEYGVNEFSDLSPEEFYSMYTGLSQDPEGPSPCTPKMTNFTTFKAPEEFDWRKANVVSRVKQQQTCGSCWTFSSTGNLESQYAIKYKKIIEFSEQQLLDCAPNGGCKEGGFMSNAMIYLQKAGGIMTGKDYPYVNRKTQCKFDKSKVVAKLSGCHEYNLRSEEELKEILFNTGPISVAVYSQSFQSYKGGVMKNCPQQRADHAVLLVGYGVENRDPYWIIKNSWGSNWGEAGYIRVMRGVNACSIVGSSQHIVSGVIA